jgi:hypothetical protein
MYAVRCADGTCSPYYESIQEAELEAERLSEFTECQLTKVVIIAVYKCHASRDKTPLP